jgi:hypothetical protein
MTKKRKHIIAISLVIIFLSPMTIKLLDGLFHHHDHFICTAIHELHFHEHHHKCPVPGFELSFYSLNNLKPQTDKTFYCDRIFISYISGYYNSKLKYSFLLRAPPVFTNYA